MKTKMIAWGIIFLVMGTCLIPVLAQNIPTSSPLSSGEDNHPPIHINGNAEFTVANGVTGGSGTETDPFMISDWVIIGGGSSTVGIDVENTTAFFVIRNCSVSLFSQNFKFKGIRFNNVTHGSIQAVQAFKNYNGIWIQYSSYDEIANSTCSDNQGDNCSGISIICSKHITITACECSNIRCYNPLLFIFAICIFDSSSCLVQNSVVHDNLRADGIHIEYDDLTYPMENNAVDGCSIYNNSWYGINVAAYGQAQPCDVGYTHILNSEIYDNGRVPEGGSVQAGIRIFYTEHNIVENCSIHGNGDGVDVVGSDNMIRNCSIFNQWQPPASVNSEGVNIWGDFFKLKVNDTLEHCDIYDNDIGVSLGEWVRQTYIHHNVIYNNSILGLISMFMVGGGNKVRMNNFEGNGHGWIPLKNHSSHYVMYAISDVRDNWWGSPRGPSLYLVTHKGNKLNQIRLIPNADSIIIFRGICRFWPWLKEPVQNAGRIT